MSENKSNQEDLNPEGTELQENADIKSADAGETQDDTNVKDPTQDIENNAKDPLEEARDELAELKDKYLRLYADFENFRRRTSKERLELIATANGDLLRSLLPVVDDLERARVSFEATTEIEPLKEGVELIYHKFYKTLESRGLKPISAKGETFDTELHESVAQFPAPSDDLKGKVIDEVEKGYYLNDKVIRYSKVVVGV